MGRSHRQVPEYLPEKLYLIRQYLRLTQKQMVDRLKATIEERLMGDPPPLYTGHISEYERGKREPPLLVLLSYTRIANIPLDNLVDDTLDLPGTYNVYRLAKHIREARKNRQPK